jgi:hypothetical protein
MVMVMDGDGDGRGCSAGDGGGSGDGFCLADTNGSVVASKAHARRGYFSHARRCRYAPPRINAFPRRHAHRPTLGLHLLHCSRPPRHARSLAVVATCARGNLNKTISPTTTTTNNNNTQQQQRVLGYECTGIRNKGEKKKKKKKNLLHEYCDAFDRHSVHENRHAPSDEIEYGR